MDIDVELPHLLTEPVPNRLVGTLGVYPGVGRPNHAPGTGAEVKVYLIDPKMPAHGPQCA